MQLSSYTIITYNSIIMALIVVVGQEQLSRVFDFAAGILAKTRNFQLYLGNH
jgi:hypothetical protein